MATSDDRAPLTESAYELMRPESENSPPLIDLSVTGESTRAEFRPHGTVWLPRENARQERSASASDESMRAYLASERTSSVHGTQPWSGSRPGAAPTGGRRGVNVVTRQPQLVPIQNSFDAESLATYSMISRQHPGTANQLDSVIASTGATVQRMATDQSLETQGEISYSEMLKGLLMDDERLHTQAEKNLLVYSAAEFFDIECKMKRSLPVGQALLTSKRLLLLSCINRQGGLLKKIAPLVYTVGTKVESATVFLPIPLDNIKSVEMVTCSDSQALASIRGTPNCCCLISWAALPPTRALSATRHVRLGVLMPPWEEKMTLALQLPSPFSLKKTTAFVASLQRLMH